MDRSFLSDEKVIKASRDFVCIRLATYESKEEAEFMTKLYRRHQATGLANTTFAFLDPTGKKLLARSGRGPHEAFRRASSMADGMNAWASEDFPVAGSQRFTDSRLPLMASFDIGLNVAACDQLLLITIVSDNEEERAALEKQLLSTSWSEEFAGQFIYAMAKPSGLKSVSGSQSKSGILVIEPDSFGLSGRLLASIGESLETAEMQKLLRRQLADYKPAPKDSRSHIQTGINLGFDWKTAIPVTDEQANRAKERTRGAR